MKKIFQFLKEFVMLYVPLLLVISLFTFGTHANPTSDTIRYIFEMSIHWVSLIFIATVVFIRLIIKNKK